MYKISNLFLGSCSVAALLFAGASVASAQSLTAVSNGGIVQEAAREFFYQPFAEAEGVTVHEDSWSQEYARLRSQADTGNIQWDVVEITYNNLALGCEEGVLERIDWEDYIDVEAFDAVGGVHPCGIPIMLVANGIAYDVDEMGDNPPQDWNDFWDLETWPGNRALLDRPTVLTYALIADGVDVDDIISVLNTPEGVERAFAKLDEIKDNIRWWRSGGEPMEMLVTGEVVMAQAWTGRIAATNRDSGTNIGASFEGGIVGGNQYMAIMAGSQNRDLAIRFLQHVASAEAQAKYNERLAYIPGNIHALELLGDDLASLMPSEAQMQNSHLQGAVEGYDDFWLGNLDDLTQRLARWQAQ